MFLFFLHCLVPALCSILFVYVRGLTVTAPLILNRFLIFFFFYISQYYTPYILLLLSGLSFVNILGIYTLLAGAFFLCLSDRHLFKCVQGYQIASTFLPTLDTNVTSLHSFETKICFRKRIDLMLGMLGNTSCSLTTFV